MNTPLVSVIVPVYNVAGFLSQCLDSILDQTYKNLEIIVIDDGSIDGSEKICNEYRKKDARVVTVHQKNSGLSSARNRGIKMASGDFLLFIDSDDLVEKTFVSHLVDAAEKDVADIVVCGFNKQVPKRQILSGKDAAVQLLTKQENIDIVAWNKIYKKELFIKNDIEYPEGKKHEDNLTTYKLYSCARKISYIDESLYIYQERSSSIMSQADIESRLKMRELAAEEAQDFFKNDAKLRQAADISLLLAKLAFLDNSIGKKISKEYQVAVRLWIESHKKSLNNNIFLTKKLKTYIAMILHNSGVWYKVFRKLWH